MATAYFLQRVIARTPAHDDCDHVPMLIDNDPTVPSRIEYLINQRGIDPAPTLVKMAQRLEHLGCEALAMPCNTAHYFAAAISSSVTIPFHNMIDLSIAHVAQLTTGPSVGLLASPAVRMTGLFEDAARRHDLQIVYPKSNDDLLHCIQLVKQGGDLQSARTTLRAVARRLVDRGTGQLVIACSELSCIGDALGNDYSIVDTIEVLAETVVSWSGKALDTQDSKS